MNEYLLFYITESLVSAKHNYIFTLEYKLMSKVLKEKYLPDFKCKLSVQHSKCIDIYEENIKSERKKKCKTLCA